MAFSPLGAVTWLQSLELVGRLLESALDSLFDEFPFCQRYSFWMIETGESLKKRKKINPILLSCGIRSEIGYLPLTSRHGKGRKKNIHRRYGLAHQNQWLRKNANCAGKRKRNPRRLWSGPRTFQQSNKKSFNQMRIVERRSARKRSSIWR